MIWDRVVLGTQYLKCQDDSIKEDREMGCSGGGQVSWLMIDVFSFLADYEVRLGVGVGRLILGLGVWEGMGGGREEEQGGFF